MTNQTTTYRNGNKEVTVEGKDGRYFVTTDVFDGVKWQFGHEKAYKTFSGAKKSAEKIVADFSAGWTQNPKWEIVIN